MTDLGEYNIKKLKTFMGTDGYGYNCDLYKGKTKVAVCVDDGGGGEVNMYWMDSDKPKVPHTRIMPDGTTHTFNTTPFENEFLTHIERLPPMPSEYFSEGLSFSADLFMGELISISQAQKSFAKEHKRCHIIKTNECGKGEYITIKRQHPNGHIYPIDVVISNLKGKYGDGNFVMIDTFEQFREQVIGE